MELLAQGVPPTMDARFIIIVVIVVVALLLIFKSGGGRRAMHVTRTCRDCGASHPGFAKFCRRCGKRM
jgi:hypothetical protein